MSEENEPNKSIFDRNNVEGVLNSIVEGSEILDEKFYSAHSRETWMTMIPKLDFAGPYVVQIVEPYSS